jgi:hypothetical protein
MPLIRKATIARDLSEKGVTRIERKHDRAADQRGGGWPLNDAGRVERRDRNLEDGRYGYAELEIPW